MLVVFVGLIVGPIVGGGSVSKTIDKSLGRDFPLVQPNDLDNDNTDGDKATGTGAPGYTGKYRPTASQTTTASSSETDVSNKIRLF